MERRAKGHRSFSSAIGAATNGSRTAEINAADIAWLSQLIGMNLNNNQPANQLHQLQETTAEKLSRLYHASEQVSTIYFTKIVA